MRSKACNQRIRFFCITIAQLGQTTVFVHLTRKAPIDKQKKKRERAERVQPDLNQRAMKLSPRETHYDL